MSNNFSPKAPKSGLIGHRGIAALAPENTKASFALAAKQGIEWVEFDLRLTKDNQLVIFHDDTLDRTTNGNGFVHEHTLEELLRLDAGSWFHSKYKNETIPVFTDMLAEFARLNLYLNIELKVPDDASGQHYDDLANVFVETLFSYWPKNEAWPLVSSFHWDLLLSVRAQLPHIPIGFLNESCTPEMIDMVAKTKNSALHCDYLGLNEELLKVCQSNNVPVLAYTVNEPAIAKNLLNAGIYGLFSDNPKALVETA